MIQDQLQPRLSKLSPARTHFALEIAFYLALNLGAACALLYFY
jgi:hypothetical protein